MPLSGRGREGGGTVMRVVESPGKRDDERKVIRLVFDVLATERQREALERAIGEALCAAPEEHEGPCRIGWTSS